MSDALKVSSDVYFYELGYKANVDTGRGGPIQETAQEPGPRRADGDRPPRRGRRARALPGLAQPPLPRQADRPPVARGRQHQPRGRPGRPAGRPAADGDRLRGDRQRRQGRHPAPRPERRDRDGRGARGDQADRQAHGRHPGGGQVDDPRPGLRARRDGAGAGPRIPIFGNFKVPVAGKTGTAEKGFYESGLPVPDQAWYAALAPADDPEIVVVVTIERGGFGADSAAPVAARILEKYFKLPITPAVAVDQRDPGRMMTQQAEDRTDGSQDSSDDDGRAARRDRRAHAPAVHGRLDAARRDRPDHLLVRGARRGDGRRRRRQPAVLRPPPALLRARSASR